MMSQLTFIKILLVFSLFGISSCGDDKTIYYDLTLEINPVNSGNLNVLNDTLIKKNEEVELIAYSNEVFVFLNWEGSINSSENPLKFSMTKDESLIANFTKKKYSLNVSQEGMGDVLESVIKSKTDYEAGTKVRLVAVAEEGWEFEKWTGYIDSEKDTLEILITEEVNLTASFVELETYCVPTSLQGFNLKSDSDSVKILDYSFDYDGRYLISYRKEIDYLRNGENSLNGVDVSLEYSNGNMIYLDYKYDSDVRGQYNFIWNDKKLTEFRFLHSQFNGTEEFISDRIDYDSVCGMSHFEGRNFQIYGVSRDTSHYYVDYTYENECLTNEIGTTAHITTFDEAPSIFTDVLGRNGFIGATYDALMSEGGIVLNYNPASLRIGKIEEERYRNRTLVLEEEVYKYSSFLEDNKFPKYFTRDRKERSTGNPKKDSFTISYKCFEDVKRTD